MSRGKFMQRVQTRVLVAAVAGGMVVSLSALGAASASASNAARYQIVSMKYSLNFVGYTHSYTVNPDPCGPTFTGTGQYPAAPATPVYLETLSGSSDGLGGLSFVDTYFDPSSGLPTGYSYRFSGTFVDENNDVAGVVADSNGFSAPATFVMTQMTSTNFANHGAYVNSRPPAEREIAAHSCVGMPVQSRR